MLSDEQVFEMLRKEDEYARGWGKAERKDDHNVSARTGQPFVYAEFIDFANKYLREAELANVEYCPDAATIRIRLLKAASCLVRALQVHGRDDDPERIAGVSSKYFPVLSGGLATFDALSDGDGKFAPGDRKALSALKPDEGF